MGYAPSSGRAQVDLAWIGCSVSDELRAGVSWNGWADNHGLGSTGDARDRSDVVDEIEIEPLVKRRIACVRKTNQKQRVAIRGSIHDGLGSDVGAATRSVLDDERLAGPLRKPLTN